MLSVELIAFLAFGVFHSSASSIGQFGRTIIVDLDEGSININQDYQYGDVGFDQAPKPLNEGVVGISEVADNCPEDSDLKLMGNGYNIEEMKENGWLVETHHNGDVHVSANFTGTGTVTIHYETNHHDGARVYHNEDDIGFINAHPGGVKKKTIFFDFSPNDHVMIKEKFDVKENQDVKKNPMITEVKINCQVIEVHDAKCICRYAIPGCYIDYMFPPPPGYNCKCTRVQKQYYVQGTPSYKYEKDFQADCEGTPTKCSSYDDEGCSGCAQKECCDGNCIGYRDGNRRSNNIVNCPAENAHEDEFKSDLSEPDELKNGAIDVEEDSHDADNVNETLVDVQQSSNSMENNTSDDGGINDTWNNETTYTANTTQENNMNETTGNENPISNSSNENNYGGEFQDDITETGEMENSTADGLSNSQVMNNMNDTIVTDQETSNLAGNSTSVDTTIDETGEENNATEYVSTTTQEDNLYETAVSGSIISNASDENIYGDEFQSNGNEGAGVENVTTIGLTNPNDPDDVNETVMDEQQPSNSAKNTTSDDEGVNDPETADNDTTNAPNTMEGNNINEFASNENPISNSSTENNYGGEFQGNINETGDIENTTVDDLDKPKDMVNMNDSVVTEQEYSPLTGNSTSGHMTIDETGEENVATSYVTNTAQKDDKNETATNGNSALDSSIENTYQDQFTDNGYQITDMDNGYTVSEEV